MTKVFCIRQKGLINEGTTEMWSYRVFTIDTLEEYEELKMWGVDDPWDYSFEDEESLESSDEWYARYLDANRHEIECPSDWVVTEILKQHYQLEVVKYIH